MTVVVKLGSSLVVGRGRTRPPRAAPRARPGDQTDRAAAASASASSRRARSRSACPRLGLDRRPRSVAAAPGRLGARAGAAPGGLGRGARAAARGAGAAHRRRRRRPRRPTSTRANALGALLGLGAVPVVNENDATATDEITFGDNDALAAQVAVLLRARLLVLLTEVEGVYSRAPGTPGAELLAEGSRRPREAVLGAASPLGRGGMRSKVLAAELAAAAGIPTVIAGGTGESRAGADPRRRAARDPLRRRRAERVGLQALAPLRQAGRADGSSSTRAPGALWSRTARACSPSASSPARGRSRPATRSSSPARTVPRSPRGSRRVPAAELAKPPAGRRGRPPRPAGAVL